MLRPRPLPLRTLPGFLAAFAGAILASAARADDAGPIRFDAAFEGGSLGKVERLGGGAYRCLVRGQQDEHGRNRQANWYWTASAGGTSR